MHLLQSIGIASQGILFEEQRVAPAHKKKRFDALQEQGYALLGKHLSRDVFLFKAQDRYILTTITEDERTPEALGAIVDDTEDTLENLSKKQLDIFDGGAVGDMALHIPAFRDAKGRLIYLIEKNRTNDFYASDFEKIEG
jgi:4-hydroxyphenylpyruvate dioxygenase-like putative hemolysin